jgi:hypothetical protein
VSALIGTATEAAQRIGEIRNRERGLAQRPTNDRERRASQEEILSHRRARQLLAELVPEELRRSAARACLHAATSSSFGVPGIVRVEESEPMARFNPLLAESQFPELASQCRVQVARGVFRWRNVPRNRDFPVEAAAWKQAVASALASRLELAASKRGLDGWTARTPELERLHDEFLRATQRVFFLRGEVQEIQSDLTVRLGEDAALHRICSYPRRLISELDSAAFCRAFPDAAKACEETIDRRIRKSVYPTRSYW